MTRPESDLEEVDFAAMVARMRTKREAFDAIEDNEPPKSETWLSVMRALGVPPRATRVLTSGLDQTPAVRAMHEWAQTNEWCLVLSATKGIGKSVAAAAWLSVEARKYTRADRLKRWWYSANELARVSGWGDEIAHIHTAQMLVIDDLGVEYMDKNGHYQSRLDALLDERYSHERKTIITTNLSADKFKARYEERIADRLREDATWFSIDGASLRGQDKGDF
jgi:hypothetical protein